MKIIYLLLVILFGALTISCGEGEGFSSAKPKSKGTIGEIVLAIDSTKWVGPVGEELRSIFMADIPGMLRSEPLFKVH
ncbi:MAG: DUF4837 family protein, partial [Bacteroidetes bacterium]|nr:DUF4837 family protein [Bacteroidota bacterium]